LHETWSSVAPTADLCLSIRAPIHAFTSLDICSWTPAAPLLDAQSCSTCALRFPCTASGDLRSCELGTTNPDQLSQTELAVSTLLTHSSSHILTFRFRYDYQIQSRMYVNVADTRSHPSSICDLNEEWYANSADRCAQGTLAKQTLILNADTDQDTP
jgi:hypothetical protein